MGVTEQTMSLYEDAKAQVVVALIEFCQAADTIGRDPQLALAEALGAFAAAAEKAQNGSA